MAPNQAQQILGYMRLYGSITQLDALNHFGCMRLGARVWELKRLGHDIESRLVEHNGKHYCEYRLLEEQHATAA